MTCNVCGYTGNNFDPNGMGRLCCPSCGAEQPEMAGSTTPSQGLEEYAAMLKQLAGATYTLQPSEDFSGLASMPASVAKEGDVGKGYSGYDTSDECGGEVGG